MAKHHIPTVGDVVYWRWYGKLLHGTTAEICPEPTEIVSKQKLIKRNGTAENPTIIIHHASGNDVIKLASELVSD